MSTSNRVHSVVLRLGDRFCSLPVEHVREMTVLPEVEELCGTPDHVLGVITLRGAAIPVVDLRKRLGMGDIMEENVGLIATLKEREQDHLNWIKELEACVHEERPFTLGLDPKACKFGRWMAGFEPKTRELAHLLHGFDLPHAAIHGVAETVMRLAGQGRTEDALHVIEDTRTTDLSFMLEQFQRVFALLGQPPRQIVTVVEVDDELVGLVVDEVSTLAWIQPDAGDLSRDASGRDGIFAAMGRVESDGRMVSMLAPAALRVHLAA